MAYITAKELEEARRDAETLDKFSNDAAGVLNINRVGQNVENLETLRTRMLDLAADNANRKTYVTEAQMRADTSQAVGTPASVETGAGAGDYVWDGAEWVLSDRQRATTESVEALSTQLSKSANNFEFSPYLAFDDGIELGVVDKSGYKLDSDTLLETIRTTGKNQSSPYLGFDDGEAFLMTDLYGRILSTGGGSSAPALRWAGPVHVQYVHSSKEVYVSWPHDRSIMFRVLWKPNGHNSLFNFRSLWWAPLGDPADAAWTLIQSVLTDYVPPITHHATSGATSSNTSTTGGNHGGANGEITAVMQYCRAFIGGAELAADWAGYTSDITVSWQNLLYAGNTINEQRFTTRQDVRARFGARTTEIVSKVTALEPIMIWREGGTQLVGTGFEESYHFYGGVQQGSVAGDSGVLDSGTKALAPTCWACVLKDPTLGYMAAWIDRGYGVGMAGVTDADTPATKNATSYKFYNFSIKYEATPHYVMGAGDSYTWRGGYSYAPLGLVDGLDSGFLFSQNGRLRIAIANSASDLSGTVVLPDDIPTTDFETIGGLDSIGTAVSFGAYSAQAYKEVI